MTTTTPDIATPEGTTTTGAGTTSSGAGTTTSSAQTTTTTIEDGYEKIANDYLYQWSAAAGAYRLFGKKARIAVVENPADWPAICHEGMLAIEHSTNKLLVYRDAWTDDTGTPRSAGWYEVGGNKILYDPSTTTTA